MENNAPILKEIAVQILGFAVVFFVLKKLAWKNLLGAIDARREKIEKGFADIDSQKKRLEEMEAEYKKRLERIEADARIRIQEAANAGSAVARDIQEKARQDAEKMVERAKSEIQQDIAKAKLGLRDQLVDLSAMMTEKIVRQKLDSKEHEKLVDQFIKELEKVG